jgi:hypothetical protein
MSDESNEPLYKAIDDRFTPVPGWGLIWSGLKPQLIMLAVLGCLIAFLLLLTMAGWLPTQTARE